MPKRAGPSLFSTRRRDTERDYAAPGSRTVTRASQRVCGLLLLFGVSCTIGNGGLDVTPRSVVSFARSVSDTAAGTFFHTATSVEDDDRLSHAASLRPATPSYDFVRPLTTTLTETETATTAVPTPFPTPFPTPLPTALPTPLPSALQNTPATDDGIAIPPILTTDDDGDDDDDDDDSLFHKGYLSKATDWLPHLTKEQEGAVFAGLAASLLLLCCACFGMCSGGGGTSESGPSNRNNNAPASSNSWLGSTTKAAATPITASGQRRTGGKTGTHF